MLSHYPFSCLFLPVHKAQVQLTVNKILKAPFPFFLNDERKNLLFVTGASLYVVLFMTAFHTSVSTHRLTLAQNAIFGLVTFITLFLSIIVLPRLFPHALDPVQWTVGKYILHMFCNLVVMGLLSAAVDHFYIMTCLTVQESIIHSYRQVAIISIIPVTLTSLILRNNMLRHNLQSALEGNHELEKLRTLERETPPDNDAPLPAPLTLRSETSETLTLNLADLLFIRADDNYSTIFWKTDEGISKKLLRANLKHMEGQIGSNLVIRCHRSYLVHVGAISNITGNANGYKLSVANSDHTIPVSRTKGKEIMETIRQMRNVRETS